MVNAFSCLLKAKVTENTMVRDDEIERLGQGLKREIDSVFGGSLAIREMEHGSDNATEIEINNLDKRLLRY